MNGETTFDNDATDESSFITNDIENTFVQRAYSGPHLQIPLTLDNVQSVLDHFKKGGVSSIPFFLVI